MLQHDDSYIYLSLLHDERLLSQRHRVFLFDMDIFIIWYDTKNRYATYILKHLPTFIEESHIASELVNDNTLDEFSVFRGLECDAAIYGSEDSTSVYIAHKDYISLSMTSHRKIHEVGISEVYL